MFAFSSDFLQISYLFRVWFFWIVLVSNVPLFFKLFLMLSTHNPLDKQVTRPELLWEKG